MAVVRARSAPPYGLIAFVALFFIATAAAVLIYIQNGKTSTDLENLRREYSKVASTTEVRSLPPSLAGDQAPDKSPTAVSSAVSQINGFKTLISGAAGGTYMETVGKAQSALKAAGRERESLADAVTSLTAERDALKKNLDEARNQLSTINTQVTNAGSQATERVNALQKDVEDERQQLAKANDAIAKGNEATAKAVADGETALNKAVADLEQEKRTRVLESDQKNAEIAKRDDKIKQLQEAIRGKQSGESVAVGQPDGEVIRVNPASSELWISLGAADRVIPGLTFTVFDPRTGVRYGTDELAAGKGSIEVIQPGSGKTPSLCRITHSTKGQAIQAGDLISNIVFHNTKERKTHFTIVGDFDLDGDGYSTADERQRLIALVTSWGGVVEDAVTTQTDYLVTGLPPSPATLTTSDAAATQGSVTDERAKERARFDAAINEAKQLSIPTLNANRFLNMIGYYSTTIVR